MNKLYFKKLVFDGNEYQQLPFIIEKKFFLGLTPQEYEKQSKIKIYLDNISNYNYNISNLVLEGKEITKEYTLKCISDAINDYVKILAAKKPIPPVTQPIQPAQPLTQPTQPVTQPALQPTQPVTQPALPVSTSCEDKSREDIKKQKFGSNILRHADMIINTFLRALADSKLPYICKNIEATKRWTVKKPPRLFLECKVTFEKEIFQDDISTKQHIDNIRNIASALIYDHTQTPPEPKSNFEIFYINVLKNADGTLSKDTIIFSIYPAGRHQPVQEEDSTIEPTPIQKPEPPKPKKDSKRTVNYDIPIIPQLKQAKDNELEEEIDEYKEEYIPYAEASPVQIDKIKTEEPSWYERAWFVWGMVGLAIALAAVFIYLARKNKSKGRGA